MKNVCKFFSVIFCWSFVLLKCVVAQAAEESSLPLADTEQSISCLVNGSVNAITGAYIESHVDLVSVGPQNLTFERSYSSSEAATGVLWGAWRHNHISFLKKWDHQDLDNPWGPKKNRIRVVDLSGSNTIYQAVQNNPHKSTEELNKGMSNFGRGVISGRTNLKNTKIELWNKDRKCATLTLGSGEKRQYVRRDDVHYNLFSREMPGGTRINYKYGTEHRLLQIFATDKSEKITYNQLTFEGNLENSSHYKAATSRNKEISFKVNTADNRWVNYKFVPEENFYLLMEAASSDKPLINYKYSSLSRGYIPRIIRVAKPDNRFIENEYYYGGNPDDPRRGRVNLQKAPVGHDKKEIITHRYVYNLNTIYETERLPGEKWFRIKEVNGGATDVYDAYNHKSTYQYDTNQHLRFLERFKGTANYQRYSLEGLVWGTTGTQDWGNLICKFMEDGSGNRLCARKFIYDDRGNVVHDCFYGNLCGNNPVSVALDGNCYPVDNGCDCYVKSFAYTMDGFNLLLAEQEPNGKRIEYTYHPNTDWMASKLVVFDGGVKKREFFNYSPEGVLIEKIEDDGTTRDYGNLTGVTERRISKSEIKKEKPGYGLPLVQRVSYLDMKTGNPVLLKTIVNKYSDQGQRVIRQDHCDGDVGAHQFAKTWNYDAHGNVLKEQNAIGETICYEYDANDNRTKEIRASKTIEYVYDFANRLIKVVETPDKGSPLIIKHEYDYCGNRTSTEDYSGNKTSFNYDEFGRVIETASPSVQDENGIVINPATIRTYDVFGNVTSLTDPLGNTVKTTYNARGKPVTVHYPDGTSESFEYNIDGTLRKSIAKNGNITQHTYDYDLRPIRTELFSADGELLAVTSATFNAFHMTSSIDAEGIVTYYTYDGAGRKASIQKNEHLTTFEYDSSGRLQKTKTKVNGQENEVIVKVQEHDLLDRVIEERLEDGEGQNFKKVNYEYDTNGNRSRVIQHLESGPSSTWTEYNGLGLPILVVDSLGHKTVIEYDYSFSNDLNQKVLKIQTTDALGNQQIEIRDALNRPKILMKKNSIGEIIAQHELFYDGAGNKRLQKETAYVLGKPQREVHTAWTYNSMGQVLTVEEGVGTPDHKVTAYKYNIFGQRDIIIKPDGNRINHEYDKIGRLSRIFSEDKSIDYAYNYDANDRPVKIVDQINQTETVRVYDINGHMIKEIQGNGLEMKYEYDSASRPTKEILPDGTAVGFSYNAAGLKAVNRLNANGEIVYTHSYDEPDLAGHILSGTMIGDLGQIKYEYDALGRVISIQTPYWNQQIPNHGFDAVGNLQEIRRTDPIGSVNLLYAYDDLYQLTSEKGDTPHIYQHDSLYNRVSKDGAPLALNGINQLLSDANYQYGYDHNGNLIEKSRVGEQVKCSYDALDRLIKVETEDLRICYVYDSFNRRLSKTVDKINWRGVWIRESFCKYAYQGQDELGSVDEQGNFIEFRMLGINKGAEIGAAVAIEIQGRTFAPIHDQAGNVACLVDVELKEVIEFYRYSAYGEEQIFSKAGYKVRRSEMGNPWRFSSKRTDLETGFVYFGRRYYDPSTGRWITPDPIGFDGGPNLYAYVMNSPLTHFDAYGLSGEGNDWSVMWDEKCFRAHSRQEQELDRNYVIDDKPYEWSWNPINWVGSVIELGFNHLVPFGLGIHELGCKFGQMLQGNLRNTDVKNDANGTYSMGKPNSPHEVLAVGGILNPFNFFKLDVGKISEYFGGVNVRYTSNASHGLFSDLIECVAQILGIPTRSVSLFTENIRQSLERVGPDGTITIVAHSQGGLITYRALEQLTPEQRSHINVITVGTAAIISADKMGLASAKNYISSCDAIPFVGDPINYSSARINGNSDVTFIESSSLPFIDHGFDNDNYKNALRKEGKDYQQRYAL